MKKYFLVGYMGAGKTTIGRKLARLLNLSFVDLDWYIEQRYHKTVSELFSGLGEDGFREIERIMLLEVADFEDVVISTGGGTPCFNDNMAYMNEKGTTVYLQLTAQQLFLRLKDARFSRPLLKDKSDLELMRYITDTIEKREPFYSQAKLIFRHESLKTRKDIDNATKNLAENLAEKGL